MATKTTEVERRSNVAEACLHLGQELLRLRLSTVTAEDAQSAIRELFEWFESHDAFSEANARIAVHSVAFGEQLLESRKSATLSDVIQAIQRVYSDLQK